MAQKDWRAEITIDGQKFRDWTSIEAYDAPMEDTCRHFRFSCTEGSPAPKVMSNMRIKPGQECSITLAGEKFLSGFVNYREAVIDAYRHGVLIAGRGKTQDLIDSSVIFSKDQKGQHKNMTFQEISEKLLKDYGIQLKIFNPSDEMQKKFENYQLQPGETAFNAIERMARMRKITLAEDEQGNLIAYGKPKEGGGETLEEGKNIKRASCRIIDWQNYSQVLYLGQTQGGTNNKQGEWGRPIAQVEAQESDGTTKRNRPIQMMPEHTEQDIKARTTNENWNNVRFRIDCEITVTGWTAGDGGKLWEAGNQAMVKAPSLILSEKLAIKRVCFTQDNARGTETTMNLSNWTESTMDLGA
jgi:prophage tail gpP-like protein